MTDTRDDAPTGYVVERHELFPDARLVTYAAHPAGPVPLGVLHDPSHDVWRVVRAHQRTAREDACMAVARRSGASLRRLLGGARPWQVDPGRGGGGKSGDEVRILAGCLATNDAYLSTRAICEAYDVGGDERLLDVVSGMLRQARMWASGADPMLFAARDLQGASPAPDSTLRRWLATIAGSAVPQRATVALDPCADGYRQVSLGMLLARTGTGAVVEVDVRVELDVDSIERGDDGGIEEACLHVRLAHDPATWDPAADRPLYGDAAVEDAVVRRLAELGLDARVGWSESGMQEAFVADMDAHPALVAAIWPDLAAAPAPPGASAAR